MKNKQIQILSENKVRSIISRISIQILENNYQADQLIIIGIEGQGGVMTSLIQDEIIKLKPSLTIDTATLSIDKSNPSYEDISIDIDTNQLNDKVVIIVDDVMNTGRTQAYALSYLMTYSPTKVETVVLVNRSHTSFPISVTYSGIALSTTLDNHIEVKLESDIGAYLY